MHKTMISAADFGARPNTGENALDPLNEALRYCRDRGISELSLLPGTYLLTHPDAVALMDDVMSGKMGQDPQRVLFVPSYPYVKGLDLGHQNKLRVVGNGATLLCRGWLEPLSLINSQNILLENLTIDYERQGHSEGAVVAVESDHFDVELAACDVVKPGSPLPRIVFWDTLRSRFRESALHCPDRCEVLDERHVRVWHTLPSDWRESVVVLLHGYHFRPGILIQDSSDICLRDVIIHSQPGMGIVGHRSRNITMERLQVVPRRGRRMSTNTDATHFASCSGEIRFTDCVFAGHGDDATNVHTYYHTVIGRQAGLYVTTVQAPTGTHSQALDFPDRGDRLEVVDRGSLRVLMEATVTLTVPDAKAWQTHIALDAELPSRWNDILLVNTTRLPRLRMTGTTIRSHMARGVLIKTRDVLIEGCSFEGCTGTAVHIGAEGSWHEGPGSADVVVRNNRMVHCGRGWGRQSDASGIAVNVLSEKGPTEAVHHNLLFEENYIEGEDSKYGIYVSGADGVVIRDNTIIGCEIPSYVDGSGEVEDGLAR